MNFPRFKTLFAGLVAGFLLAIVGGFLLLRSITRPADMPLTLDAPAVVEQIQRLSELISVKYTIQRAIGLEEKKFPVGAEKILLFVHAEVLAGVDLSRLRPGDVTISDGSVAIALPPARVIHVVIDDTQTKIWDRSVTWWTPWVPLNPDLERKARLRAREEIEAAALEMGILDEAARNAESAIQTLLTTVGYSSVTVRSAT